jgi:alpha-glucosidase
MALKREVGLLMPEPSFSDQLLWRPTEPVRTASEQDAPAHAVPRNQQTIWQRVTESGTLVVDAPADDILRIAFRPTDAPAHRTWFTAPSAAQLPLAQIAVDDHGEHIALHTARIQATISILPSWRPHLRIVRQDGSAMQAEATIGHLDDERLCWASSLADGESVFGGGERTGPLNKRGRSMTFWTTDPAPEHGDLTDAMYQSVPFLISMVQGKAHGVFFDSPNRAAADIGKTHADELAYATVGADLVVYVFAGPTLADVLRQYTAITGRMSPVPRWALGNQQARWSYMTADDVLAIAAEFRARSIPCDAIYLDIDYMDGFRVFTWDPERFPDPAGMIRRLCEQHFRVVPIIDPGVKLDATYPVYREGEEHGYFVRTTSGSTFEGWVWPGRSVWVDFAQTAACVWWGEQHRALIEAGVAGIWTDMNEPTQADMWAPEGIRVPHGTTLPDDAMHSAAGEQIPHATFHNAYAIEMVRATREGLQSLRPEERPFVLTRAASAGAQRYAIIWNGDTTSSWEHLRLAVPLNLGASLSGFPMTGGDIGGFWGDTSPELLVRWTQLGAFLPFCRNHSARGTASQEPWVFGEPYTQACRVAIERRYQLLPYLVTLAHEAAQSGAPIMRPLGWIAPSDADSIACDDEFLVGDALLVAPVLDEGATSRSVLLPPGEWFAWDSDLLFQGNQRVSVPCGLDTIPVFVRSGTVLPLAVAAQHSGGITDQPLTLHVYVSAIGQSATMELWDDDDHPEAEQRGSFSVHQFQASWRANVISISMRRVRGWLTWRYPGCRVSVHLPPGWMAEPLDDADDGSLMRGDTFSLRYRVSRMDRDSDGEV